MFLSIARSSAHPLGPFLAQGYLKLSTTNSASMYLLSPILSISSLANTCTCLSTANGLIYPSVQFFSAAYHVLFRSVTLARPKSRTHLAHEPQLVNYMSTPACADNTNRSIHGPILGPSHASRRPAPAITTSLTSFSGQIPCPVRCLLHLLFPSRHFFFLIPKAVKNLETAFVAFFGQVSNQKEKKKKT